MAEQALTTGSEVSVQSEPASPRKPSIDPRRYIWVKQNNPKLAAIIDDAAEIFKVSPIRIAATMATESRFRQFDKHGNVLTSEKGALGLMQVMPGTASDVAKTLGITADPRNTRDNIFLGAAYIKQLDDKFGVDTPESVTAYFSGPAGNFETEKARNYRSEVFTGKKGADIQVSNQAKQINIDPQVAVRSGVSGGPDTFLRYIVDSKPQNMSMSDAWRRAESSLIDYFILRGDMKGAMAARDFVTQMSFTGTNQHLMAAHRALSSGQGVLAAQHLAKAHAFFPDSTIGRFRSDGKNVVAERVDEDDPSRSLGTTQITPEAIAGLLNQTSDPQQYLKTLMEQQKGAAEIRYKELLGDRYAQMMQLAPQKMALDFAAKQAAEQGRQQRHQEKMNLDANKFALSEQGKNQRAAMRAVPNFDKEINAAYDPSMAADQSPEGLRNLGQQANVDRTLRSLGVVGPQAQIYARGLADGNLKARITKDGAKAGIFDAKTGQPLVYLPPNVLRQMTGPIVAQPRQPAIPHLGVAPQPNVNQPTVAMPGFGGVMPSAPVDEEEDE